MIQNLRFSKFCAERWGWYKDSYCQDNELECCIRYLYRSTGRVRVFADFLSGRFARFSAKCFMIQNFRRARAPPSGAHEVSGARSRGPRSQRNYQPACDGCFPTESASHFHVRAHFVSESRMIHNFGMTAQSSGSDMGTRTANAGAGLSRRVPRPRAGPPTGR